MSAEALQSVRRHRGLHMGEKMQQAFYNAVDSFLLLGCICVTEINLSNHNHYKV